MNQQDLIELLADKVHASWARWMEYLFSLCEFTKEGSAIIPPARVDWWRKEIALPYAQLEEEIKQSDRDEVMHLLPIIEQYRSSKMVKGQPLAVLDEDEKISAIEFLRSWREEEGDTEEQQETWAWLKQVLSEDLPGD